ncbi:MAG: carbonic anhydrase family protein [Gammaproteobacteria bacterium]|nr:carbonic anhydrase family protein [Gammaproteobacteria bacterium]
MKSAAIVSGLLFAVGVVWADDKSHWSYSGQTGPEHWGGLKPEFNLCGFGRNQTPINIEGMIEADLPAITFNYQAAGDEVINNGHTIQVNFGAGSNISVDGQQFELKQFHFHSPSENHIQGKSYALEGHLVHADKDGNLAVVAVMFEPGAANEVMEQAWKVMPEKAGGKSALGTKVSAEGLLPAQRDYYQFNGSLTTPPCSEGVRWLVMKEAMTASEAQIEHFSHVMHHPTNRPLQPVFARPVLQ